MGVEIYFSMRDKLSNALKDITGNAKTTRDKLNDLAGEVVKAEDKFSNLRMEVDKSNRVLSESRKAFLKNQDAASTINYKKAIEANQKIKKEFKDQEKAVKQVSGAYDELRQSMSKTDNQVAAMSSSRKTGEGSMLSSLGKAGAINMAGGMLAGSASSVLSYYLGSSLGERGSSIVGGTISGAVSGAASGAAIGSIVPGLGTAAGAVGGAVLGGITSGISAFTEDLKKDDEAFKNTVQSYYDEQTQWFVKEATSGIDISSNREQVKVSLNSLLKDEKEANTLFNEVKNYANITPYTFDQLSGVSKMLAVSFKKSDDIMGWMKVLGDAAAATGASESDMQEWSRALTKIKGQGKASREFLDIFSDRGVSVYQYLAKDLGISQTEVFDRISKGKINANQTLQAIQKGAGEEFKDATLVQSETYAGKISTLQGMISETQNSYGEAYTKTRMDSVQKQIEWYQGDYGTKMKEVYAEIGKWQAELENKSDDIQIKNMEKALDSIYNPIEERKKANQALESVFGQGSIKPFDTSLPTGDVLYQTLLGYRTQGNAEYKNTLEYSNLHKTNKGLVESIQNSVATFDTHLFERDLADTLSKGAKGAVEAADIGNVMQSYYDLHPYRVNPIVNVSPIMKTENPVTSAISNTLKFVDSMFGSNKHASGLSRVPYDGYPALLHEGERVQTAQEVRQQEREKPVSVAITGNTFIVRQDSDIEAIAQELARRLEIAGMIAG